MHEPHNVRCEFRPGVLLQEMTCVRDGRVLATSRADFMKTIGRPAETLERNPALPKLPPAEDDVIAKALKQNPALVTAQANERAANYAVDDAWGAMGPTLSVQGQYQYSQSALNSVVGFGAGGAPEAVTNHALAVIGQLNVPIYQAGVEEANIRQARGSWRSVREVVRSRARWRVDRG